MNFSELCKHNHCFFYILSDLSMKFYSVKIPIVRHLIFICGRQSVAVFQIQAPWLNLASLSAKLFKSIYIVKDKKEKKWYIYKYIHMNSKFAEHPPSLDIFFPSLFCNSFFFFFPPLHIFKSWMSLTELFPVTVLCTGACVCVCYIYIYIFLQKYQFSSGA